MVSGYTRSEDARERTAWPHRGNHTGKFIHNGAQLKTCQLRVTAQGRKNETVAQGDNDVRCAGTVKMLDRQGILAFGNFRVGIALEHLGEQEHD